MTSNSGIAVSIIICTCNRARDLRQTLAALAAVSVPADLKCELIVVDNASTDDTAQVARSCSLPSLAVRYLYEGRAGVCYARNSGVAAARGEIILFTDDDVRPPQTWLQAMCGPLLAGQCQAVSGGVRLAPALQRDWMGVLHQDWLASTEHERPGAPLARVGANMGFLRSVLARVPKFDTELGPGALGFADDTLFLSQLEAAGYRICPTGPQSVIVHHCDSSRLSRSSLLASSIKHGRSGAYLAHHWEHRHYPQPSFDLARARLRLAAWRTRRRHEWTSADGCPEWELQLTRDVHFFRQYIAEQYRPHSYDKHGLIKNASPVTEKKKQVF